jgi:hypothetical protein
LCTIPYKEVHSNALQDKDGVQSPEIQQQIQPFKLSSIEITPMGIYHYGIMFYFNNGIKGIPVVVFKNEILIYGLAVDLVKLKVIVDFKAKLGYRPIKVYLSF